MSAPDYEDREIVEQYLLFHYARGEDLLPWSFGPREALHYPRRVVEELVDRSLVQKGDRGLDMGCAVGGSSFALAELGIPVLGVDLSKNLIAAARRMAAGEAESIRVQVSGRQWRKLLLSPPTGPSERGTLEFRVGDALDPPLEKEETFGVILMINLIDRIPDPVRGLDQAVRRLRKGGQLIIASPYTWLEEVAPPERWLTTSSQTALEGMQSHFAGRLELAERKDLPFLIREHERKYQWSVAEGTRWVKR